MEKNSPVIIDGNGMSQMFDMQKKLMKHYISIEAIPQYPIDIHSRLGQKTIKNGIYWFIEELSEAYAETIEILNHASQNSLSVAYSHLEKYNEEIADVMHFLIELLIYSGIENAEDVEKIIAIKIEENGFAGLIQHGNPLGTLFSIAGALNQIQNLFISDSQQFIVIGKMETLKTPYLSGCSKISPRSLNMQHDLLWTIVHALNQLSNLLKNREWHQREQKANIIRYYDNLANCLIIIFQYLNFLGFTELGLFQAFWLKNEILEERILNGS